MFWVAHWSFGLADWLHFPLNNDNMFLPLTCTALVDGQPLMGRKRDDAINPKLTPLPVAWVKTWTGNSGKTARVFHSTMGMRKIFKVREFAVGYQRGLLMFESRKPNRL